MIYAKWVTKSLSWYGFGPQPQALCLLLSAAYLSVKLPFTSLYNVCECMPLLETTIAEMHTHTCMSSCPPTVRMHVHSTW